MARAVQTAELAAGALGVDVVVREGLREFGVGARRGPTGDPDPFAETFAAWLSGDLDARVPGAESGAEVAARSAAALDEVADTHRGERVLVVSHGGVMCMTVSALAAATSRSATARDAARWPTATLVALEGGRRRVGGAGPCGCWGEGTPGLTLRAGVGTKSEAGRRPRAKPQVAPTTASRDAPSARPLHPLTHSEVTVSARPSGPAGTTSTTALRLIGP